MKLNKTDYVLERASDGGYYAWLTVNMQLRGEKRSVSICGRSENE